LAEVRDFETLNAELGFADPAPANIEGEDASGATELSTSDSAEVTQEPLSDDYESAFEQQDEDSVDDVISREFD
jgi:hypothetical protein